MTDQNRRVNSLKAKFSKIEEKINPSGEKKRELKTQRPVDYIDTSFIQVNAKKVKAHKKVLASAEKQLDKNKADLKVLLELKDDNHYKIEKLTQGIYETKRELANVEDSIRELQQDRIDDEARAGRLQTQKVELEAEISDQKRHREVITSNYHNLLNSIYLKEGEISKIEDELTSQLIEIEKVEKNIAKETRNFRTLSQDFEKKNFRYQKAQVKYKNLSDEHKEVVRNIKEYQAQIDQLNQEIFKFNGDNDRIGHHIRDLQEQYENFEAKYTENFTEVERLRDKKTALTRRRDELLSNIKALKNEHSKNILELEVRSKEKSDLEKEANDLISKKTKLENAVFSQKATIQSFESSIYELSREKTELNDSIKLNKLHFSRHETEIVKLRKEANSLKEQYTLLISENERVKKEAQGAKHRFIDAQNSRDNWSEKREMIIKSISDMKAKIVSENNQIDTLSKEITEIQGDFTTKEADIQRYKTIHENTFKQVEQARAEHEKIAGNYRKLLKERSSWSDRLARREEYIHTVADKVEKIKESIYATEQNIDQDRLKLQTIDAKLDTLKNEQDYLAREYKNKQNEKLNLEQKISHMSMRVAEVEDRRNEIIKEIDQIKSYIAQKSKELPELEERNETLLSAIDGAKAEHRSLKSSCDDIKKEIRVKEDENKSLEADFERVHVVTVNMQKETKVERAQLEKRFAALTQEKVQIEEKIHKRKSAMLKLSAGRQEVEKEVARLTTELKSATEENKKIDHEAQKLKAYIDKKSLEIQTMRSRIKNETETNISKKAELKKLQARSEKIEKQLETIGTDNDVSTGVIKGLGADIRALHDKNAFMASDLENEVKRKEELKKRIHGMKRDIDRLKESLITEQNRVVHAKNERESLESEYAQLQQVKETLLDEIEMKMATFEAEGEQVSDIEKRNVQAKREVRDLEATYAIKKDTSDVFTNIEELAFALNTKYSSAKNASVMLDVANELVKTLSDNETAKLKWMAKVSSNVNVDGMKIRFKNIDSRYSDIKRALRPVTRKVAEKFKAYGLNIETRSKTSPGEVVEALDFKVTLQTPKSKELEIR